MMILIYLIFICISKSIIVFSMRIDIGLDF